MKGLTLWLSLIAMIILIIFIESYKYKDCIKVGHTSAYCLLNIGK